MFGPKAKEIIQELIVGVICTALLCSCGPLLYYMGIPIYFFVGALIRHAAPYIAMRYEDSLTTPGVYDLEFQHARSMGALWPVAIVVLAHNWYVFERDKNINLVASVMEE